MEDEENEKDDKQQDQNNDQGKSELDNLRAQNAALEARLAKLEGNNKSDDQDDDLNEKSRKEREAKEKSTNNQKALESALRFDMGAKDWLKQNASLLPSGVADIFETASKETYDTPVHKDNAVKAGIVKEFFSVQANLDLLTPGLKNQLEDYLKLSNTGRQDKAQAIYSNIFEPAFEMLKRVKKAEALQKGHGDGSEDSYRDRLIAGSRKHFLGETTNA